MMDVYHATVDDLARAALQSLFYFNYLRGGPSGTGPSKNELQLRHTFRIGNLNCIVKLLDRVVVEARINIQVPHLDAEMLFGTVKRRLDLPPGDDNDSHRHNRVNFSIPMLGKGTSTAQAHGFDHLCCLSNSVASSSVPSQDQSTILNTTLQSSSNSGDVVTSTGWPIFKLPCLDPS